MPRTIRSRLREALKNFALVVASIAICLVLLEIGVRIFTDIPPVVGQRDPVVGKRYRPGFRDSVFVEEAGREIHLVFNRDGFRGEDVPYERAPDVRRIAVLGDSLVAAVECDEEDTFVRQLQRLLNDSNTEHRWEVLNFGVGGSSTGQELVLYREIVSRYGPEIVVAAYFVGNDFSDNSRRMSSNPRIYFEIDAHGDLTQLPFSVTRSAASTWLNRHSRLYVWQKKANDVLRSRTGNGYWIFSTRPSERLDAVWELNERLIVALRDEVESRGGRFVLVLFPSGAEIHDDKWERLLEQAGDGIEHFDPTHPERRLTALGRRHGIPVVPLREEFRRAVGGRNAVEIPAADHLFFGGFGHFTERGHLLAARIVHDFLTQGEGREILDRVTATDRSSGER
jgi:hypothetical protein